MSDYKLILVNNNDGKVLIRYRFKGNRIWNNYYTEETDMDKIINDFLEFYKNKYDKAPSDMV